MIFRFLPSLRDFIGCPWELLELDQLFGHCRLFLDFPPFLVSFLEPTLLDPFDRV